MWTRLYFRNFRFQDCTQGYLSTLTILRWWPRGNMRIQVGTYNLYIIKVQLCMCGPFYSIPFSELTAGFSWKLWLLSDLGLLFDILLLNTLTSFFKLVDKDIAIYVPSRTVSSIKGHGTLYGFTVIVIRVLCRVTRPTCLVVNTKYFITKLFGLRFAVLKHSIIAPYAADIFAERCRQRPWSSIWEAANLWPFI